MVWSVISKASSLQASVLSVNIENISSKYESHTTHLVTDWNGSGRNLAEPTAVWLAFFFALRDLSNPEDV